MPELQGSGLSRGAIAVALFTAAYMLPAFAVALLAGNQEFVFYAVVMVVLVVCVLTVHRQSPLTDGALWALSIWGLLHMAGGLVPIEGSGVLYNVWLVPERLKFDQVVHAYGFATATWVCWQVLSRRLASREPLRGPLILSAAAGMGLGALNEVVEFAATLLVPETNVGGYENTGWDLVANLVGAVTAVTLIAWQDRRTRR